MKVICQYCGQAAKLVTGEIIYPSRKDLHANKFYHCKPCDAYVGCHKGTTQPFGTLSNSELRFARRKAHLHFDGVWKSGNLTKGQAYKHLAKLLNIDSRDCHIGMFDLDTCRNVVTLVKNKMFHRKNRP